ncbi:hypothetical protein ABPG74_009251 [Tetrahymena malaccensis]
MDQISQQIPQQNQQMPTKSFEINLENKTNTLILQIVGQRIEISLTQQGQYLFKWRKLISIEQAFKLHSFFLQFQNLDQIFEIFSKLMQDSIKSLEPSGSQMIIAFEFEQLLGKIKFSISLDKLEVNSNDAILNVSEKISNLETTLVNQQNQLDQIKKDQTIQIEQMKDFFAQQIQQMKNNLLREVESMKTEHKNQIQDLKNEISQMKQKIYSNILLEGEYDLIKGWIGNNQIQLQQIYRATVKGFQIERIYDSIINKKKLIYFIKTTQNIRFGFYTDGEVNSCNDFITQNPNSIFLFSLDQKKKYTCNEAGCSDGFYFSDAYLAVGIQHDLVLFSNSNSNNKSYIDCSGYGRNEGITNFTLNGGSKNFTTKEIEIFEVIFA